MEEQNYKQLYDSVKDQVKLEVEYAKLTLAEKLSVLLSKAVILVILIIFGEGIVFMLLWAFAKWMIVLTNSLWLGVVLSVALGILLAFLGYGYSKKLIFNPVTKCITKLLLTPEE